MALFASTPPGQETGEKVYRTDRRQYIQSMVLTIAMLSFFLWLFVLLPLSPLFGGRGPSTSVFVAGITFPILLAGAVLGFYMMYVGNHTYLVLTTEAVELRTPLYRLRSPWHNVVRLGPADIKSGNPQADAMIKRMKLDRHALILHMPIRRQATPADPLGELLRRWLDPKGQEWQKHIVLTEFMSGRAATRLVADLREYAPHLAVGP